MALNQNQFAMEPVQGDTEGTLHGSVFPCQVSGSAGAAIVPGEAVKCEDSAGGVPKVLPLAANTDKTFGFAIRTLKDINFAALDFVEIAGFGTLMYMTAGAAVARMAKLEVVYTTKKVITSVGVNPVVGYAFDKATADGDLIRVLISTPNSSI